MRFSTLFAVAAAASMAAADSSVAQTTYTQTRTVLRVVATTTMTRSSSNVAPTGYLPPTYGSANSTIISVVGSTASMPSASVLPSTSAKPSGHPVQNGAASLGFGLVEVAAMAGLVGLVVV
ncbi:Hypothetical protein R9X50_00110300 [Acrodontium crateriforme]|uniref:Antifreeze protein n=1 Tax=Acrodontium crateriforme TaxID=150365 RepID=A0AAQ3M1V4_9PEZI|nr:Hypothetical protein R9X50_00110300 [Acrodontium crateriforme]